MAEIERCSSEHGAGPIGGCKIQTLIEKGTRASSDASETASSSSSRRVKGKRKAAAVVACKRRNPRVVVRRRARANVDAVGFPLGMSFAAVLAQVLYRRDAEAESMSPNHLSLMCTSAIKESLASVFGDKLDGLMSNFEQSFDSTLSTLRLIYESSTSNERNKVDNMKMEISSSKLNKGDCSRDVVSEEGHPETLSRAKSQHQPISLEEIRDNFHMDSVSRVLALHGQSNQMVCFSPTSSESANNPIIQTYEKSIVEQCRSNDLKTIELGLTMQKLKLKETELALHYDLNNLERSKLAMGASKASFKAEKFKNQLEDMRHGELTKKCIDCLIAGLFIMSSSLVYGAYVYSYKQITEATESCAPSEESFSWWTPKSVVWFNSGLHVLWCQVQVLSRMLFGVLVISAVGYLLIQRSAASASQTMPVTFIIMMLGIGCGYCGKLCVDTLGGSGYVWLLYWEILCLLHFLSVGFTSLFYSILHGPLSKLQSPKENTIFPYWIRRFLFYVTLLVFLPLSCGLLPFASIGQWKDYFMLKVLDFYGSEV